MVFLYYRILACLMCCPILLAAQLPDSREIRPSSLPKGQTQQAQAYLTLAKEQISKGHPAEAQYLLSRAIAGRHDLSEAYLLRAGLKRETQDLAGAVADYSVVVYQQPEHYEARFQRAITQYDAQRYEAAREDFQYLLDHPAGETNTLYFKGKAPTGTGGVSSNITSSEEFVVTAATTLQSDMKADLLNYLGLCYWHTSDFIHASEYFLQAMVHHPEEPMAYVNLGLTYEATGDTLQAIEFYQQALQKAPDHTVALRNLSSLARQRNDTTLEREVLLGRTPSYDALLQQGMYYHRQGEYEAAIRSFSQALVLAPRQTEGLIQRGFTYEKALRLSEALDDYTQAILLDPQAEKAYSNRGNIYFRNEEYAQALADYDQALTLEPENATAWYNRGLTHDRLGNRKAACRDLQRASELGNRAAAIPLAKICGSGR